MTKLIQDTLTSFFLMLSALLAGGASANPVSVKATSIVGFEQQFASGASPTLYTRDFSNCLTSGTRLEATSFDAAYYADNATVLFRLDGQTSIPNEPVVMHVSMQAYGDEWFRMAFDPCSVNMNSLCSLESSVAVTAWAAFAVTSQQSQDIPGPALSAPDVDASFSLRIFGNSSRSEIGCFQAGLTNGRTIAHSKIISPILAMFVLVAMVASLATITSGSVTGMRKQHAGSISVLLLFETFQAIFFSGMLELDFPNILPAWWSNFAWAAGQIRSDAVIRTANLSSRIRAQASEVVGATASRGLVGSSGTSLAQQIYGHSSAATSEAAHYLTRRYDASDTYDHNWSRSLVGGSSAVSASWIGFPSTLALLDIPVADAFAVGLIWLLVLIAILVFLLACLKLAAEMLVRLKMIEESRLAYLRTNFALFLVVIVLRVLYAAFSVIATLACSKFALGGPPGAMALVAVVFVVFLLGIGWLVGRATYLRLGAGRLVVAADRVVIRHMKVWKLMPGLSLSWLSSLGKDGPKSASTEKALTSLPFIRARWQRDGDAQHELYDNRPYGEGLNWLMARYKRRNWWFPAIHVSYQLVRAAIVGGGSASPMAQVCCLLIYDILAFVVAARLEPFDGRLNNVLAAWMLGPSKLITTGLSIAFLSEVRVNRSTTAIVGIIIVVVQSLLTIGVMVLVALSAVSSYHAFISQHTNVDVAPIRDSQPVSASARGLKSLHQRAADFRVFGPQGWRRTGWEKAAPSGSADGSSFRVISVRRIPKIYDETEDTFASAITGSVMVDEPIRPSRSVSACSTRRSNLPRRAGSYRATWTPQEFAEWDALDRSNTLQGSMASRQSTHASHRKLTDTLDASNVEDSVPWSLNLDFLKYKLQHRDWAGRASNATSRSETSSLSTSISSRASGMAGMESPELDGAHNNREGLERV